MTVLKLAPAALVLGLAACNSGDAPDADSGTIAPEATSPAPANAEEDIRSFLMQEYPDAESVTYALAWSDLNGDGADEAIVYLAGPYFCGTGGCPTLVLTAAGPMWSKVGDISVSRTPVTALDSTSNGWKDLTVAVSGGGGASGNALLKFDGTAYPANPTVAPAEMTDAIGTVILEEDPVFTTIEAQPVEPAASPQ